MKNSALAEMPWNECKVSFDIDNEERFLDASTNGLPSGWEPSETYCSPITAVGIFDVTGPVLPEDGKKVLAWLKKRRIVEPRKAEKKEMS